MPEEAGKTTISSLAVTLISHDGHSVAVPLELARYSRTICALLDSQSGGGEQPTTVHFPPGPITARTLQEAVRYMRFRREWEGRPDAPRYEIDPDIVRDLTLAADYLDL